MNISERVQDIFNRFNINLEVSEQQRTELAEATLENGTVIYTDGDFFDEGAEVYIINDEGERIPLPPGDYTLADGVILNVVEGGKIGKVDRGNVKEGDKGDGKRGEGVKPGNVSKPEDAGRPAAGDGTGRGDTVAQPTPPSKTPTPPPAGGGKKKKLAEDEKDEMIDSPVTREMVEEMIKEAIAALLEKTDEKQYEEEDKEEMAAQEVATEEVATEEVVEEVSENTELKTALSAIEDLKTQLAELQKTAATPGLKHAAPAQPKAEPVDLTTLTTAERVRVLANQFSK